MSSLTSVHLVWLPGFGYQKIVLAFLCLQLLLKYLRRLCMETGRGGLGDVL